MSLVGLCRAPVSVSVVFSHFPIFRHLSVHFMLPVMCLVRFLVSYVVSFLVRFVPLAVCVVLYRSPILCHFWLFSCPLLCVLCVLSFSYFASFLALFVPLAVCVLCFVVLLFCVRHICPANCRSLLLDLFSCIPVFVIPVSTYRPKRLDSWQCYAQRDLNFPLFAFPW